MDPLKQVYSTHVLDEADEDFNPGLKYDIRELINQMIDPDNTYSNADLVINPDNTVDAPSSSIRVPAYFNIRDWRSIDFGKRRGITRAHRRGQLFFKRVPVKFNTVGFDFKVNNVGIIDCTNFPTEVGRDLTLIKCDIRSLLGITQDIGRRLVLSGLDNLTSLEGISQECKQVEISNLFNLTSLKGISQKYSVYILNELPLLKSLEFLPEEMLDKAKFGNYGIFSIYDCKSLTSLRGFPKFVNGTVNISTLNLKTLEGIGNIDGDFNMANCPNIGPDQFAAVNIGDKVKGEITVDYRLMLQNEKARYTRAYNVALNTDNPGMPTEF